MKNNFEEYILEVAEQVNEKAGRCLNTSTLRWIEEPDVKASVADAKLAFCIDGVTRKDAVAIIVSNPQFPNAVNDATKMAASVVHRLDMKTGSHVLLPMFEGTFGCQSYAVFPKLEELSSIRWLRYLQKKCLGPKIVAWLEALALQTRQYCNNPLSRETLFIRPLNYLLNENSMSSDIQNFARCCLKEIFDDSVTLTTIVEHGDCWVGNVLLERSFLPHVNAFYGKYFIIDWGGARLEGYPGIDITRYCLSTNRDPRTSAHVIHQYAVKMDLSPFELGLHCMSSLGYLGLNRNQFTMDRYTKLVNTVFDFLNKYGFTSSENSIKMPTLHNSPNVVKRI